MATYNQIQMKRSAVPGKVPTTSDLALGEFGINTYDGKVYIKKDDGEQQIVEVGVKGATAVQNVYYVSKSGNDANDGKSLDKSKLTIKSAVEATKEMVAQGTAIVDPISGALTYVYVSNGGSGYELPLVPRVTVFGDGTGAEISAIISGGSVTGFNVINPGSGYTYADIYVEPPGAGRTGAGATIFVKSGDYTEDNPIYVPPGVCVVGDSLRAVTVRPQNPTLDLFWVCNKSYFTEMTFRDHKAPAAVFAFPSVNITNITNTSPARVTFSGAFTYDRVKCSRDLGLIVDSLAQDLKFPSTGGQSQSAFAGLQYWSQSGYTVPNVLGDDELAATILAMNYLKGEIADLIAPTAAAITDTLMDTIIKILDGTTNPATITDDIVPNSTTASTQSSITAAYTTIQAARTTLRSSTVAYIQAQLPALVFDTVACSRDVGYIIDTVCYDLLYGGNRQVIQSGIYYLDYSATDSTIPNEKVQTVAAYNFLKTLIEPIVTGTAITTLYQTSEEQVLPVDPLDVGTSTEATAITDNIDLIIDIINNGPSVAPTKEPIGLTASAVNAELYAYDLLVANRKFIRAEVIAYIDRETTYFDRAKCYRDVGLIVDSIATDIVFGGRTQTTFAGIQYWSQATLATSSEINPGEIAATIDAYQYLKDIALDIIQDTDASVLYTPVTYPRLTALDIGIPAVSDPAVIAAISDNFDLLLSILNAGDTDGVSDLIVPSGIDPADSPTDQYYATLFLIANLDFFKEQITFRINDQFPSLIYDQVACERDVGYVIECISRDNRLGGNRQTVQAAVYYYSYLSASTVPSEIPQIEKAYNYIKILASYIITGQPMPYLYQEGEPQDLVTATGVGTLTQVTTARNLISYMLNIINDKTVADPPGFADSAVLSLSRRYAGEQLLANRDFIAAEVVAYLDGFTYNRTTCARDTGLIVDALVQDTLFNGSSQTTFAAIQYWGQDLANNAVPPNEVAATAEAINYLSSLAAKIVRSDTTGTRYQVAVPQVTDLINNGRTTDATNVSNGFTLIKELLDGTVDVTSITSSIIPNSVVEDTNAQNAYDLLQANKAYLIEEVIAYIADPSNPQQISTFFQEITGATNANPVRLTFANNHTFTNGSLIRISDIGGMTELNGNRYYTKYVSATEIDLYEDLELTLELDGTFFGVFSANGRGEDVATTTCRRDVGYMVDSISFDLLYNADPTNAAQSNKQAVQSGVYYWEHSPTISIVPGEKALVTAAYDYIKRLATYIVQGKTVPQTYGTLAQVLPMNPEDVGTMKEVTAISDKVDLMLNIINAGPGVAPARRPIDLVKVTDPEVIAAALLLDLNREFIVSELISYVDENYAIYHPFSSGDTISIRGVQGMTEINNGYIHEIIDATNTCPVRLTFGKPESPRGHVFGDRASLRISGISGMIELNGNRYYSKYVSNTEIDLYFNVELTDPVDGTLYGAYGIGGNAETDCFYYVRRIDGDSVDLYLDRALTQPVDATEWGPFIIPPDFAYGGKAGTGALPVSPYVHNCSSITTTGAGMRVDGNLSAGLKSMVLDSFTQINEGGNGIEIINRGYAQLVSIYTICTDIGILCKDGGFCSVANSDSSFGTYALVADGLSDVMYSATTDGDLQTGKTINLKGMTHRPNYGDAMDVTSVLDIESAYIVASSATISLPGAGYEPGDTIALTDLTGTANGLEITAAYTDGSVDITTGDYYIGMPIIISGTLGGTSSGLTTGTYYVSQVYNSSNIGLAESYAKATAQISMDKITSSGTVTGSTVEAGAVPTFRVATVKIVGTPTVLSQSGTFNIGDRLTFTQGFGTPAVLEVNAVNGSNEITQLTIIEPGVKNTGVTSLNLVADIVQGGTSATVTVQFGINTVGIASFGSLFQIGSPSYQVTGGSGTGAELDIVFSVRLTFSNQHYFRGDEQVTIGLVDGNFSTSDLDGMTGLNGNQYFIKLTGNAYAADLHVDSALLLGVDVSSFSIPYIAGTGTALLHDYYTVITATDGPIATAGTYVGLRQSQIGLEIAVKRPIVNESIVEFRQRSIVSSSGHTFEYIGSGNILSTATPEAGAYPIPENEVVELRGGKAYFTGTNEQGDFKIGTELVINRDTGTISGRTFNKSLFAVLTPYILALEG